MSQDIAEGPADVVDMTPKQLQTLLQATFATNGIVVVILSVFLIMFGARMDRQRVASAPARPLPRPGAPMPGNVPLARPLGFWAAKGPTMVMVIGVLLLVGGVLELAMGMVKAAQITDDKPL